MAALHLTIISAYPGSIPDDTSLSTSAHQDPKPDNTMTLLGWVISRVSLRRVHVLSLATTQLSPKPSLLHHKVLLILHIRQVKIISGM